MEKLIFLIGILIGMGISALMYLWSIVCSDKEKYIK